MSMKRCSSLPSPTCYAMFFAFDSDNIVKCYFPFSTSNKCWRENNGLQDILKGIECKNKLYKTDGLQAHIAYAHPNSW